MENWGIGEAAVQVENEAAVLKDIYKLLVEHYKDENVTVIEGGYSEDGLQYGTEVRCGVPGNQTESQRLYEITVDVVTGKVTEKNMIFDITNTYELY